MKQIPILFSTAMVQALLEGRKTQTRRVMKPQIKDCDHSRHIEADWKDKPIQWSEAAFKIGRAYCGCCGNGVEYSNDFGGIKCPYGKPGDVLWVRETFRKYCKVDEYGYTRYDQEVIEFAADNPPMINECDGDGCTMFKKDGTEKFIPWKPSIFLPKEAARIWLQVMGVKVERLQDITEDDAIAEGGKTHQTELGPSYYDYETGYCNGLFDAKDSFRTLWKSINGADSWAANPWVWAISFKVLSTTGKPKTNVI